MTEHKATPHRAKPETWAFIEQGSSLCGYDSCLLELRDRVEALEAGLTTVSLELRDGVEALEAAKPVESNDPAEPDSSLVERVEKAMWAGTCTPDVRVGILEVAMWLRQRDKRVRASVEIAGDLEREIKQQPS
jgi:hypothetical protein